MCSWTDADYIYAKLIIDISRGLSVSKKLVVAIVVSGTMISGLALCVWLVTQVAASFGLSKDSENSLDGIAHTLVMAANLSIFLSPEDPHGYSSRAGGLQLLKEYEAALKDINTAISKDPRVADFHVTRGDIYRDMDKPDLALLAYKKAIEVDSKCASAYSSLARFYENEGKLDEATDWFERGSKVAPHDPAFLSARADFFKEHDQPEKALASFDQIVADNGADESVYVDRARVLDEMGRSKEALVSLDKAIELAPTYKYAYEEKADILYEANRFAEAVTAYSKAIEIEPDNASLYQSRAKAYEGLHQKKNAQSDYAVALKLHDQSVKDKEQDPDSWHNRGITLQLQGNMQQALSDFQRADKLSAEDEHAHMRYHIAYCLNKLGRFDDAAAEAQSILQKEDDYSAAYEVLAAAMVGKGNFDQAITLANKAIRLNPDTYDGYACRAQAYRKLGKTKLAEADEETAKLNGETENY